MSSPGELPNNAAEECTVTFDQVADFVRHLAHDIRNGLGAIDLQAAYLTELIEDEELAGEAKKVRSLITQSAAFLQRVSALFRAPQPSPIRCEAGIFFEDFRDRLERVLPENAPTIAWHVELGEETVLVDLELMFTALAEFIGNAAHFYEQGCIHARVRVEGGAVVFELREAKSAVPSPPETWGTTPFVSSRRGGYGLGLF
nr:hypothetical protein [Verrucomicrobiota bacterium]